MKFIGASEDQASMLREAAKRIEELFPEHFPIVIPGLSAFPEDPITPKDITYWFGE